MRMEAPCDLVPICMARTMAQDRVAAAALPVALLAALLARAVHNPNLTVFGSLGAPLSSRAWGPDSRYRLSLTRAEALAHEYAEAAWPLAEAFGHVLRGELAIWICPAQLDAEGSANISCIGPWERPKVALVGSRGLPDDGWHLHAMRYYVPMHGPRTLVPQVDFVSAPGRTARRREADGGASGGRTGGRGLPGTVVTSLGVFRYTEGGLEAVSLHPGTTPDDVRQRTPFAVGGLETAATTLPPTEEERRWLARLDPLGVRRLEFLPPKEARACAREIATAEAAAVEERSGRAAAATGKGERASR